MTSRLDQLQDAAVRIGRRLVEDALWAGERCTWPVVTSTPGMGRHHTSVTPARDDVYQGTAGIALFLGELWGLTRAARLLACARGALAHSELEASRNASRSGLYSGDVGAAYVATRLALLTGDDGFTAAAARRVARCSELISSDTSFDVIGGGAGGVLGLLAMDAARRDPAAVELAIRMGDHLVRTAVRRPSGWSWNTGGKTSVRNLCGYAHGTSGMAHAFLELFARTGDRQWRFAASRAMAYEREHVADSSGDWFDFRCTPVFERLREPGGATALRAELRAGAPSPRWAGSVMRAWCHGGPGIALTRMRSVSLGVDVVECAREATAALDRIRADLPHPAMGNYSLCHGAFGNAESLLLAHAHFGGSDHATLCEIAAAEAHELHARGARWPSGAPGGVPDPSLLLGEAGIGHFLLRLANPDVPSVLCLSDWSLPPNSPGDDTDLHRAELERLLPRTITVARRSPALEEVRAQVTEIIRDAPTLDAAVAQVACAVQAHRAGGAPACVAEALALDLALLEAETGFDDFLAQFCHELARPMPGEVDWTRDRFVLAPTSRLLRTRWRWSAWFASDQPAPAEEESRILLYRDGRMVRTVEPPNPVALVLEAVESPRTLADVVSWVLARVEADAGTADVMQRYVQQVLATGMARGMVEVDQGAPPA